MQEGIRPGPNAPNDKAKPWARVPDDRKAPAHTEFQRGWIAWAQRLSDCPEKPFTGPSGRKARLNHTLQCEEGSVGNAFGARRESVLCFC